MGKAKLILLLEVLLLLQIFGNTGAVNQPINHYQESTKATENISLNQVYSESDFFYSRIFFDPSRIDTNRLSNIAVASPNRAHTVDIDSQNNIVMAGSTDEPNFSMINGLQSTYGGGIKDGYIIKLSESAEVLWSTFLGGNLTDEITDLEIDSNDNILVTGSSSSAEFPTTSGVFQENLNGSSDIFLTKFSSGGILQWSTLIGGDAGEGSFDRLTGKPNLTIDNDDNIIIVGQTQSDNYPVLNPYQGNYVGSGDLYVTKFSSEGQMVWSTYLGSTGTENTQDVIVDKDNNIIIGGAVSVFGADTFPLVNAHQTTYGSRGWTAFLVKFSSVGQLEWSTLQGGTTPNWYNVVNAIVIDQNNQIITCGRTEMTDSETTSDAQDKSFSGGGDSYLAKYDTTGVLTYGSYYGTKSEGTCNDMTIDAENNIYLATTRGPESIPLNKAYFSNDYNHVTDPLTKPVITKINPDNSVLWNTDYLSSSLDSDALASDSDNIEELIIDNKGRLITIGMTEHSDLPGMDPSLVSNKVTPFLSIMKLDPLGDEDDDNLLNYEEFSAKTSPHNADSDGDGLSDGEEIHISQTSPINDDTDNDGLKDKFEIDEGFEADKNDTDFDKILDGWEWENGLDPNSPADSLEDFDGDDLSNLDEFKAGTDPNLSDTDGDGMNDGYEIKHNLDPLNDDTNDDKDNDFLPNKFEHDWGLNPDNPIETIVAGFVLISSIAIAVFLFLRSKQLNTQAIKEGFTNHTEKKSIEARGFTSLNAAKEAELFGFETKLAKTLVQASGYQKIEEMIKGWESQSNSLQAIMNSFDLDQINDLVNSTTSPIDLHNVESSYKQIKEELNQLLQNYSSTLALQEGLADLLQIADQIPLRELTTDDLAKYKDRTDDELDRLNTTIVKFHQIFDLRKAWFEPWLPLLTLIQMTQDGLPIELSKITEVIRCPENQAENLLELLLEENPLIGSYSKARRVYTKGTEISNYIESMLEKIANFGD